MKALTICNPYPELILLGEKPIENREWATNYRGQLLIHAGKSYDWMTPDYARMFPDLVYGAIVGVCNLVACLNIDRPWPARFQHLQDHEHANGQWCWVLEDVRRFEKPVACRGAQGLWIVPPEIQPLVRDSLAPKVSA